MAIVTLEQLTRAMVTELGLDEEAATDRAEYVLDIFGFERQIIDNVLEPEDRQLFYSMEEHGIVSAGSEENTLHHGQDWRTHYWTLKVEHVHAVARAAMEPTPVSYAAEVDIEGSDGVYADLPRDAWTRR